MRNPFAIGALSFALTMAVLAAYPALAAEPEMPDPVADAPILVIAKPDQGGPYWLPGIGPAGSEDRIDALGALSLGRGLSVVRPRRSLAFDGLASDDHDFGHIGYSTVDSVWTDPSPTQIGLQLDF